MMGRRGRQKQGETAWPGEIEAGDAPGSEVTVVGDGARLEGSVVSVGSLRINGQVKGQITATGVVTLTPESLVEGDIQAQDVVVGGTITGDITAKGKIALTRGARVEGTIRCAALSVGEGAVFSGQSIMDETPPRDSGEGGSGAEAGHRSEERKDAPEAVRGNGEDGLRKAHEDAVRQAAQWFGSRLPGPGAGSDDSVRVPEPGHVGKLDGSKEPSGSPSKTRSKIR